MVGVCALSNNPLVGVLVHNISERSLVQELQDRQIPIPPKPLGDDIGLQAMVAIPCARTRKRHKPNTNNAAMQAVVDGPLLADVGGSSRRRSTRKKTHPANIALQEQVPVPSRRNLHPNNEMLPGDAAPEALVQEDTPYV
jgi:hypothetical protein